MAWSKVIWEATGLVKPVAGNVQAGIALCFNPLETIKVVIITGNPSGEVRCSRLNFAAMGGNDRHPGPGIFEGKGVILAQRFMVL